ncbi:EndoU domain-containing protein [Pannonibacter tanglangensis]|nr:EndoU domain-containing protein [Pannonibacter sp. XCT-53]
MLFIDAADKQNKQSNYGQRDHSSSALNDQALNQSANVGGTSKPEYEQETEEGEDEKSSEHKPSLLDEDGDQHILDGDGPNGGGGHRSGTGKPGKSEFPSDWSDDKIRGEISDVATDPKSNRTTQPNGRIKVEVTHDGIDITVIVEQINKGGRIVTSFPTNTLRNP